MSNSTVGNGSYPKLDPWYLNEYNLTMLILYVLIVTAAIAGNLLICAAVCINIKLRRNVASYFIVSLAIADLCTAMFSMTFDLESYMTYGRWLHGDVFCDIWITAYLMTVPISIWNLFVLSIDRYKTLKNPWDRYKVTPFMTPRRALLVIAVLWIYCLIFALIPLMGWNFEPPMKLAQYCWFDIHPSYAILSAFLNFYFPMFAMCFVYYKIYEIARTQYLMPSGLGVKTKSLPSGIAGDERGDPHSMNNGSRYDYESCKPRDAAGSTLKDGKESGVSNVGLEIENGDKEARTKTFCEVIEETDGEMNQGEQNNEEIERDIMKDERDNEQGDVGDNVSQTRLEDVTLREKEKEEDRDEGESSEEILEDNTEKNDLSTGQTTLEQPEASVDENINKTEEKNNSLCDDQPRQAVTLIQEKNEENSAEEDTEIDEQQDNDEVSEEQEEMKAGSSNEEEQHHDGVGASSSTEPQLEGGGSSDAESNHGTISLEMQTYLRKKVFSNEDREKSTSRDSLQSICTLQSTLPDSHTSVIVRGEHKHQLSASRDTLNSGFGSMEDLTKRRKIFVKNKKAARTISIIVSAFLICWIPFNTYSIVLNICKQDCSTPNTYRVMQILLLFGYLNSILNPIIFSYQNIQFRIAYRKMLRKAFPCLKIGVN